MLRRVLALSVLLPALTGCGGGNIDRTHGGGSGEVSQAMDEQPADVAHIVCGNDTVQVDTPVVRAHRDGVRLDFDNPGGAWGFELHPENYEYGQAMGGRLRTSTFSVPPGEVLVACLPTRHSSYRHPDAPTSTFTIVDPEGLYVPWDLACGFGEQVRMTIEA
jgi:hypothetical protein